MAYGRDRFILIEEGPDETNGLDDVPLTAATVALVCQNGPDMPRIEKRI